MRAFISLVGMRGVGEKLKGVLDAFSHPVKERGMLWKFVRDQAGARLGLTAPEVPVQSPRLQDEAGALGRLVRDFSLAVQDVLRRYRETVLERQYVQERIADAACDVYASSCALSRLDHLMVHGNNTPAEAKREEIAGRYFLKLADRRARQSLASLTENDDDLTTAAANAALEEE
jgi:hypothetical protein